MNKQLVKQLLEPLSKSERFHFIAQQGLAQTGREDFSEAEAGTLLRAMFAVFSNVLLGALMNLALNPSNARGAFNAATAYNLGDSVTSDGVIYTSLISANTNNPPATSPAAWRVAADPAVPVTALPLPSGIQRGVFNPKTVYDLGDGVSVGALTYVSLLHANVGHVPATSPEAWKPVA